jgi:hypothetical protein
VKGDLDGYYDHVQAGFSSLGKQNVYSESNFGAHAKIDLSEHARADASYDHHETGDGKHDTVINGQTSFAVGNRWTFAPGVTYSDRQQASGVNSGQRTDLGARATYALEENRQAYVYGQGTVDRSGTRHNNNRVGVGGKTDLTEKLDLSAEVSTGNAGFGAAAKLDYKPTADDHYYLGYALDPDREFADSYLSQSNGYNLGAIVAGANHAYSEHLSIYTEEASSLFSRYRSLTQTYGVKYTPDALWTFGGGFEVGNIWDETINDTTHLKNSNFDRKAVTGTVAYHDGDLMAGHIKAEGRIESSQDHTRDLNSYLLQTGFNVKTSDDWRLSANLDAVISDASTTTRSGKYAEGSVGFAYRPVNNDRLNALFKYTYLYDLPGADQVTVAGTLNGASQMSNILSADVNYDLTDIFTIGGKYGFRIGETKDRLAGSTWQMNSAHLAIARVDMHVVKNWDALAEARMLWTPESQTQDFGVLAAIYRQMGDNFKIGVGYNFGHFSDDLRSIGVDNQGVFINAIGKF